MSHILRALARADDLSAHKTHTEATVYRTTCELACGLSSDTTDDAGVQASTVRLGSRPASSSPKLASVGAAFHHGLQSSHFLEKSF
jgi:hypothetical protein